jgi:diacylglycerol kinase family enzyme
VGRARPTRSPGWPSSRPRASSPTPSSNRPSRRLSAEPSPTAHPTPERYRLTRVVAKPEARRRLAAAGAIAIVVGVTASIVLAFLDEPWRLAVEVLLFVTAVAAGWYALTRTAGRRVTGAAVAVAAVGGIVGVAFADGVAAGLGAMLHVALLLLVAPLARYALRLDLRTLERSETHGRPVPAASRGVLLMNPRSGGGKAERFDLVDQCRQRGIEPVVLRPGDDLTQLARDALDRGADVIGMAGGDGSQALVAAVAAQRGVPMVVVPAGTRNHLALDIGLDRNDVVGALDAYVDAVERLVDLADVNGRVFVNNVSLGLYAAIVRSPEYRDAKVDTTLATLPQALGPGTRPFDLCFTGRDGERHEGAHIIQISNNPYGKKGSRPRLDTGRLGVITLEIGTDRAAAAFLAAVAAGHPERFQGFTSWTPKVFEVTSSSTIDVGLDGEAITLDPPLRFSIRPEPLRVRLPSGAIGLSPAARVVGFRTATLLMWRTALGRPVDLELARQASS